MDENSRDEDTRDLRSIVGTGFEAAYWKGRALCLAFGVAVLEEGQSVPPPRNRVVAQMEQFGDPEAIAPEHRRAEVLGWRTFASPVLSLGRRAVTGGDQAIWFYHGYLGLEVADLEIDLDVVEVEFEFEDVIEIIA
jgi:hypothetical protein